MTEPASSSASAIRPLEQPVTEIEKARLVEACQAVLNPEGVLLLRRVLFQLDVQRQAQEPTRRERLRSSVAAKEPASVKAASQRVADLILSIGDTKRSQELLAAIRKLRDADWAERRTREGQSQLTPTTECPDGEKHVLRCIRCEVPA